MGSNGATLDAASSSVLPSLHQKNINDLVDDSLLSKIFGPEDLVPQKFKLKTPNKKSDTASSNWKEMARQLEEQDKTNKESDDPTKTTTGVTQLDDKDLAAFSTGRPLTDDPDYSICKHCRRPILRTAAAGHVKSCLKIRAEKAKERKKAREEALKQAQAEKERIEQKEAEAKEKEKEKESNGDGEESPEKDETKKEKKLAKGKAGVKSKKKDEITEEGEKANAKNSKKRKATEEPKEKAPKAKKKKEKPVKAAPKPKGPVDVERQCGVELPQGGFCARSLTCKSHSMGAKRSVLGRSQPYDVLLAAYQKKNQAKQQKAAINANNPAPDDIEANSLHVDSDEETDLIMAAVARSNPQPLVYYNPVPVRRRYQYIRMTNLLGQALRPVNDPPMSAASNFLTGLGFTGASPTISSPVNTMMGRPSFPTPSQQAATRRLSVAPVV